MREIAKFLGVCGTLGLVLPALADTKADEKPNPMLPDAPFRAHDMARPLPPVVVTAGAVEVKPPSDATVLFDGTNIDAWEGNWEIKDGIFVKPARVTVIHNGVVVQNGQAYMGPTTHKKLTSYPKIHPETGPLRLQWHKDPIEFRNIWVRSLGERDLEK